MLVGSQPAVDGLLEPVEFLVSGLPSDLDGHVLELIAGPSDIDYIHAVEDRVVVVRLRTIDCSGRRGLRGIQSEASRQDAGKRGGKRRDDQPLTKLVLKIPSFLTTRFSPPIKQRSPLSKG
jgi:hypothetical protein